MYCNIAFVLFYQSFFNNHYGEATLVYIYSKFIKTIIYDLNLDFYSFKKLLHNNL